MAKNIEVVLKLDNQTFNRNIRTSGQAVDRFSKNSESSFNNVRNAFIGLAGALSVREIVSLSDEFLNLNNRLVAVTGSQEVAASALDLVRQVAADSRSDLSSVASLFADLTVATQDLGTSQADIATATRVFSQTLQISGADAGAAAGAIRQFGQALASGTLRGDEFNSITESNSFFMLQLADSIGRPLGELRELAREGKLTAEVVLAATMDMADQVEQDFSTTATTVSQAFTSLRNSVLGLLGNIESETGVFTSLANAIQSLADSINTVTVSAEAFKNGLIAIITVAALFLNPFGAIAGVIGGLARGIGVVVTRLKGFRNALRQGSDAGSNFLGVFKSKVKDFFGFGTNVTKQSPALAQHAKNADLAADAIGRVASAATAAVVATNLLNGEMEDFVGPPEPPGLRTTGDGDDPKDPPVVIPEKEQSKLEKFEQSLRALKVTQDNYEASLERLNNEFGTSTVGELQEYNKALRAIESAFPEQAEAIRELLKEQERQAEIQAELAEKLAQGKEAIEAFNEGFTEEIQLTADLNEKQSELNALLSKYPELASEIAEAQDRLNDAFSDNEGLNSFLTTFGQAQKALSEDLATALVEGKSASEAFQQFFKKLVVQLIADALRLAIIQPILGSLFGISFGAGGAVSGLTGGGLLGFLGGRANGGPVMKNKPYIVGERGPELFVPGQSGGIVPNEALGLGGGTTVNYNIQAVDAQSFQALVARDPEFIFAVTEAGRRRLPQ